MGPYLGDNVALWRCPSARPVTVAGVTQPRVRTVSLNCFMGSPVKSPAASTYAKLSELPPLAPAQALTFLAEKVETINDGSFALQWDFDAMNPAAWTLRDKPEVLHGGHGNLSFADGHAESRRWRDARTLNAPRDDAVMAGNPDVLWLQQHATWRPPRP
jgi:prepilin-type processing-associated H-X9-DG protein